MTVTLYVNWEQQEIYQNEEELVDGYIGYGCDEDDFRHWLDDNYSSDEIFAMTQSQKEEAENSYREHLLHSARYWAYDQNMKQEINI